MSARQLCRKTQVPSKALYYFPLEDRTGIAPTRIIHEKYTVAVGADVTVNWDGEHVPAQIIALSDEYSVLHERDLSLKKQKSKQAMDADKENNQRPRKKPRKEKETAVETNKSKDKGKKNQDKKNEGKKKECKVLVSVEPVQEPAEELNEEPRSPLPEQLASQPTEETRPTPEHLPSIEPPASPLTEIPTATQLPSAAELLPLRKTVSSTPMTAASVPLHRPRRYQDQLSFLDDLLDKEDDVSVHEKLDKVLENQKVLFKLIADLMRGGKTVRKDLSRGLEEASHIEEALNISGGRDRGSREKTTCVIEDNNGNSGEGQHVVLGDISNVMGGPNVLGGRGGERTQSVFEDNYGSSGGGQHVVLGDISNVMGGPTREGNKEQSFGEEGEQFMGEALFLKRSSCSVGNFAAKFISIIFKPDELINRNCTGTRGKQALDPAKMSIVKKYVLKLYPCAPSAEESMWRKCIISIDEFLRRKKRDGGQRQD